MGGWWWLRHRHLRKGGSTITLQLTTSTFPTKQNNKRKTGQKKAKKALTFTIDCSKPVEDQIMDLAAFEQFLASKIKVLGKAGALGDVVSVKREGKTKVVIESPTEAVSKRYVAQRSGGAPVWKGRAARKRGAGGFWGARRRRMAKQEATRASPPS